jgi:hypothetical protein
MQLTGISAGAPQDCYQEPEESAQGDASMTEIIPPKTVTPCDKIEPVFMDDERRTFEKVAHQTAFATFNNWAHHEARRLCERGSCVTGTCRGHVDVSEWRLEQDDGERFTCAFSAKFFCRCD